MQCGRSVFNPWVRKILLENGNLLTILAWKIPWMEDPDGYNVGLEESDMSENLTSLISNNVPVTWKEANTSKNLSTL